MTTRTFIFSLAASLGWAKTDLYVQAIATQALIALDADNSTTACTIDVRDDHGNLVNDVNSGLFAGSNLDSRHSWNASSVRRRIIVGARVASRALKANTLHTFTISTCVSPSVAGSFKTMNPPFGNSYADPLPVDPANPGQYLYPTVPGSGAFSFIDQFTGFEVFRLAKAYDTTSSTACGDCDMSDNCWDNKVAGPGGVMGYHCTIGRVIYWIDPITPTFNVLGTTTTPYNPTDGTHAGWAATQCAETYWVGPNRLLCTTFNPSEVSSTMHALDMVAVALDYTGGNTDLGPLADGTALTPCGGTPCWTITDVSSASKLLSLNALIRAATPEYDRAGFGRGSSIHLSGRMGTTGKVNMVLRKTYNQNTLGMEFVFDPVTSTIPSVVQSYHVWPGTFAGYHGVTNINDAVWVQSPNTQFKGALSGNDNPGNGPYISVTTGSVSATPGPCGTAGPLPAGSVPWPTGNHCTTIPVDGEPGDPTPAFYATGTISVSGTTAVTGSGTSWDQTVEGRDIKLGASWRTVAVWIDATHITLNSAITYSGAYTIYLEPVNNVKTGNPLWGYLQDAAPGDMLLLSAPNTDVGNLISGVGYIGSGYPTEAEPVRLLSKSGNNWLVQRGWSGDNANPKPSATWATGSWANAWPASCSMGQVSICAQIQTYWNTTDTTGANIAGTTVVVDANDNGCCHGTFQNGAAVNISYQNVPTIDGLLPWHWARNTTIPTLFSTVGYPVLLCGTFGGLLGECVPNASDTHPSHNQSVTTAVNPADTQWIADGHPYLGGSDGGTAGCPATLVSGSLYTFSKSSNCLTRYRPRVLPTMASCGWHPLLDISSIATGNQIGTTSGGGSDQWKYCTALHVNECRTGSAGGDVFLNCPGTTVLFSDNAQSGGIHPTVLDLNITDMGAVTQNMTQLVVNRPAVAWNGRRLSSALMQWKRNYSEFWHTTCLPGGEFCFTYNLMQGDSVDTIWAVRMLPLPPADSINRSDFITVSASAKPATGLTVDNMIVKYGYDANFFCTTRQEACVAGNTTGVVWASEAPAGVAADGQGVYTVKVPAISQRALYTQIVLRNSTTVVQTQAMQIQLVQ